MDDAIFLSASVPDPFREPAYAKTADPVAIGAAVSALLFVTLGRRRLVWGGQPAITAIVRVAAESLAVDFGRWVRLYQSAFFADEFPEENADFGNVIYTPASGDRASSLRAMREKMFSDQAFSAAVFIGGMKGIVDEFNMIRILQPSTSVVPLVSTGGATIDVARHIGPVDPSLETNMDYVAVLHEMLAIDPRERRYLHPDDQPLDPQDRLRTDGSSLHPAPGFGL